MKRQIKYIASVGLSVAMMALALAGATVAQAAPVASQIAVENQDVNSGVVVIDSVTAAQNGWVVLYKNSNLDSTAIVGHAWVHQGSNPGVKVTVNMSAIGNPSMLWAAFLADDNPPSVRQNWGGDGLNVPGSAAQSQPAAVTAFATTANSTAGTTSAKAVSDKITIQNQDITSGLIVVDSVTTNQDGWVVLYRSPDFNWNNIVGFAPVYRGTNTGVVVKVDASKLTDQTTLWAQLHANTGFHSALEWGNTMRTADGESVQVFNDAPVIQNKSYIRTSFATTGSSVTTSSGSSTSSSTAKSTTSSTAQSTALAKGANQISVSDQSLDSGVIVLDTVTAAQDGWVVIHRTPSLGSNDIVGYAPIYQGTNSGVRVTIDKTKLTDQEAMLWATLLVDQGRATIPVSASRGRILSMLDSLSAVPNVVIGFGTSGPQSPSLSSK